ncbi:Vacuolar protein sorting-associated protein ist1 [Massospora cicadina]|nr:Vacuolar protein sorting-associated protein ist1 [Massospora cicadina]
MFSPARLKIHLKLCINRLKLLRAKKDALSLQSRREVSALLANNKEASAKIRVESIVRDDDLCEVLEMLELYCELLLARFGLLESTVGSFDASLVEATHGLIYSAARCSEVKELLLIRDQLALKIGREAYLAIVNDTGKSVNPRIVNKLLGTTPNPILVERYLAEIGQRYGVPGWSVKQESEASLISLEGETPEPEVSRLKAYNCSRMNQVNLIPEELPKPKPLPKHSDNLDFSAPSQTKPNSAITISDLDKLEGPKVPTFEELESRFRALKNKP